MSGRSRVAGRVCACGCGGELPTTRYYGRLRVVYGAQPRFLVGHAVRTPEIKARITGRPDVVQAWLTVNQGKYVCQCGCGKAIKLCGDYHSKGVPAYFIGHHPNSHRSRSGKLKKNSSRRKFRVAERIQILARCGFVCVECGWGGVDKVQHLEIDHVVSIARGGETVVENGQALCVPCHFAKSKADNRTHRTHVTVQQRSR